MPVNTLRQRNASWERDVQPPPAPVSVAGEFAWQPEGTSTDHMRPSGRQSQPVDETPQSAVLPAPAITKQSTSQSITKTSRARSLGLIIGAVLVIETVLFAVKGFAPMSAGADPTAGRTSRVTMAPGGPADLRLLDVLQVGPVSPRGVTVKENQPGRLIALANASLHARAAARDVDEGAYWLKRYIFASLGEEHMLRALTQLGSAYAEPANGVPDFVRARQLWEFASTFGDPVAMCFLGALHEHGLGVAAEKKAAQAWYVRAKSAGGCPQLEEAIARVSP